jgi:ComF family protein
VSGYPYAGWVANAIRGVKYGGEKDRAAVLGALLATTDAGDVVKRADVVVFVPMHRSREAQRGYNQAAVMAESLCRTLGVAPPVALLAQREKRSSQVGLSARERRINMRGAFVVREGVYRLRGCRVVLVDDVRTTGSTLNACVDALRPYRPAAIDVVTFAAELSDEVVAEVLARGVV